MSDLQELYADIKTLAESKWPGAKIQVGILPGMAKISDGNKHEMNSEAELVGVYVKGSLTTYETGQALLAFLNMVVEFI
jgi:hypothetical protein